VRVPHTLVGFGFGPIQAGLFAREAAAAGNFERIVVAEIDPVLVDAVRGNANRYDVSVAHADRVETVTVENVELLNPAVPDDRATLLQALHAATEVVTSLPSVDIYRAGGESGVAALLAEGLAGGGAPGTLVYAAENNNHAAERLEQAVAAYGRPASRPVQYLNTVIGKMSRVIADGEEIDLLGIGRMTPAINRAFLVERFNHILVTACRLSGFRPGIEVFEQKPDLLPFEEAKLYGHNAIHALLAYLGQAQGYTYMTELREDAELMDTARRAFIDESGAALRRKYASLGDPLFTQEGYRAYADDLLERMTNPHLADTVARAARDPLRKLGYQDRLVGTMVLALEQGIEPRAMARGVRAALQALLAEAETCGVPEALRGEAAGLDGPRATALLRWVWGESAGPLADAVTDLVQA
jgi:mannitol-1-phosphate 5-dehydrogenase